MTDGRQFGSITVALTDSGQLIRAKHSPLLGEVTHMETSDGKKITIPKSYKLNGPAIELDGTPIPHFLAEDGPHIEALPGAEDSHHILWLPVIIEAPLPAYVTEAPGVPLETGEAA